MTDLGTHVKIFRKVVNNELFCEKPFDRWHAFEWLLIRARYYPTDVVIKGQTYHLETGQLLVSTNKMAEIFGWSRGKVLRFLETLNATGIATSNGTTGGTLVTIENYSKYQLAQTADGTADGTPSGTEGGTHKNKDKERIKNVYKKEKVKKEKSVDELISEMPEELQETLRDFVEMRKQNKSPLKTQRQFTLLANKLNELSGGDSKRAKAILEQSIMNGWKSVYEVKEQSKKKTFMDVAREIEDRGYGN